MNSSKYLQDIESQAFRYYPTLGVGYHPLLNTPSQVYNEEYFAEYIRREDTSIGHQLTKARYHFMGLVNTDLVIDIGVGSGAFVRHAECYGYDINYHAVEMLRDIGAYLDPYSLPKERSYRVSMCFWDSLEHIPDPAPLLEAIDDFAFVSMPIYRGLPHILASKHYKPNEHCWYFTNDGLKRFMAYHGFTFVTESKVESELGRDGIESFIFSKHIGHGLDQKPSTG